MTTYTVNLVGPPSNPAQQDDSAEAAEAREAAATFDGWLGWLDDVRDAIAEGGGDSEDPDAVLASILDYVAVETEAAGKAAEERATKHAKDVLREARDSNHKIAVVLRQQREAREQRTAEDAALARRLDEMADAIAAVTRENVELKARLAAQEKEIARATAMLEKEIAKERSLRRLLDAQRNRPHTQRVASELAKKHAEKMLKAAASKTEATIQ